MKEFEFDISVVESLIDLAKKKDVSKLEVSYKDFGVIIELGNKKSGVLVDDFKNFKNPENLTKEPEKDKVELEQQLEGKVIKSPIVGTFYTKASPDSKEFVKVGDNVKIGDVLCIIESMKLMNEIKSEFEGRVSKILLKDGDAVEYGQSLIVLE